MAIRGNLEDIRLNSIIALCCHEKKQSCLRIMHGRSEAALFFKDGQIIHAVLDSREGEEVLSELTAWDDGSFEIEQDVVPPKRTVAATSCGLLQEDIRHYEEGAVSRADSTGEHRGWQSILSLSSEVSEQIGTVLCHLLGAVGGRCVLMADRSGRLAHWQGGIDRARAVSLAALIAGSFSATAEVAETLRYEGESRQFIQSLHEGEDFSIFSVSVGERSILSLCFKNSSTVPLGLVRIHTLKAACDIQEMLGKDVVQETGGRFIEDLFQDVGGALNDLFGE